MSKKKIAKRYLISLFVLYFAGALLMTAFVFALSSRSTSVVLQTNQIFALGLLLPLVPCASYAGFCTAFLRVDELSKNQMVLIVAFIPVVLVLLTVFGAFALLPSVIYYIYVLIKKD